MRRIKKTSIVLLIVAGTLICGAAGVAIWQWDNLRAAKTALQNSSEDLQTQLEDSGETVTEALDKIGETTGVTIHPLTDEQRAQLQNGELDESDAIAIMTGSQEAEQTAEEDTEEVEEDTQESDTISGSEATAYTKEADTKEVAATGTETEQTALPVQMEPDETIEEGTEAIDEAEAAAESEETAVTPEQERIAEIVAEVYVMRDTYIAKLEEIKDAAAEEYLTLADAERTTAKKASIALRCIREGNRLEADCDVQIETLLAELKTLLDETGGDITIIDDIAAAYEAEKETKKAYYINLYKDAL